MYGKQYLTVKEMHMQAVAVVPQVYLSAASTYVVEAGGTQDLWYMGLSRLIGNVVY